MLETVASCALTVSETAVIKKNRLAPKEAAGKQKRIAIVTGVHGDELEGQYVCYELIRRITRGQADLTGIVDVYPALNPLGIDAVTRQIPRYDLDMNRIFPGGEGGTPWEHMAKQVIDDIAGADLCIDIHSSDIFLREIPQVRISSDFAPKLLPYAKLLNADFVWVGNASSARPSSLSYTLNSMGTPCLVVEMGAGLKITKEYGDQLLDGIFALMAKMDMWTGRVSGVSNPMVSTDGEVTVIHCEKSGIFMPAIEHWIGISEGDHIGDILNVFTGETEEEIFSPVSGTVFTLREYPVVSCGSLIARIFGGGL
ncbi:MAG: succinylglutamate desuccinylase/aspartoacylase family protein [Oscillospiraceae bacterium]|nr:succinylglutamate desuccinylase/aspartoacylase family protein [Oscillospiraceae bacterium]